MLYISDTAKEQVQEIVASEGYDKSYFVRISVIGGGCSGLSYKMEFDNALKAGDQQFEDKGIQLVCDLKSFLYLCNTTLHFTGGLNGKGFHFENPNAERTCACGESFSL